MSPTPHSPNHSHESLTLFFKVLVAILIFGMAYFFFVTLFIAPSPTPKPPSDPGSSAATGDPSAYWSVRGQFGDMFGGLNALFSGVTLAGLIYTLHLQRKSMAQQGHSLHLQQQSLEASLAAIQEQSRIASEATHLQALIAQLEQCNRLIDNKNITPETRVELTKQAQTLTIQINALRETYSSRAATLPGSINPIPKVKPTSDTKAQS